MSECICRGFTINKMCPIHGEPHEVVASEVAKRLEGKFKGIACLKHDLTHYLVCGHCHDELKQENEALNAELDRLTKEHVKESTELLDQIKELRAVIAKCSL